MTGPASDDSPLTSYEATVAAAREAVAAAVAANEMQQVQARQWFDARLPTDESAHEPATRTRRTCSAPAGGAVGLSALFIGSARSRASCAAAKGHKFRER